MGTLKPLLRPRMVTEATRLSRILVPLQLVSLHVATLDQHEHESQPVLIAPSPRPTEDIHLRPQKQH